MHSPSIQKLINLFSKFPTIGPRTASRFAFYLLKMNREETEELLKAISEAKNKVKFCRSCFKSFEEGNNKSELCEICRDSRRQKNLICLVEKETDLYSIEKIKKYQGVYFILGGLISNFKKTDLEKIRIENLLDKFKSSQPPQEIIIALNPTTEGEATSLYLERKLKPFNVKVSRLGRGLPIGGELEYADDETLASALEGRK
jgi:recombination protein RecR